MGEKSRGGGAATLSQQQSTLKALIDGALSEKEEAHTALYQLTTCYSQHVGSLQAQAGKAENYEEAMRLQSLKAAIDTTLQLDGGYDGGPGGGFGPARA